MILSLLCVPVSGCGEDVSEGNVRPGDTDYPAANPNPTRFVELTVALPSSLAVEMSAVYQSDISSVTQRGLQCNYKAPLAALVHPFNVTNAMTFKDESDSPPSHDPPLRKLRATVTLDKYSEGACHWHFAGVIWHLPNGDRVMGEDMFALSYNRARDGTRLSEIPQGPVYLVCSKDLRAVDPSHAERCTTLDVMQSISRVSPEAVASLPKQVAGNRGVTWIMPDTKDFQITFFDLGAPSFDSGSPK
jgi:hypothetical protein